MINVIEAYQGSEHKISYGVSGDILTVTVDGVLDWIDFSQYPDGECKVSDVETILPINPFLSIKKHEGATEVELAIFYGNDEKEVYESGFDTHMEIFSRFFG